MSDTILDEARTGHASVQARPAEDAVRKAWRPDFILTFSCPDRAGIVHAVSGLLANHGCNILDSAQFSDQGVGRLFMRVSFNAPGVSFATLHREFSDVGGPFDMNWDLHDCKVKPRLLIMVSKAGHCLNDLLFRYATGALNVEIPLIDLEPSRLLPACSILRHPVSSLADHRRHETGSGREAD